MERGVNYIGVNCVFYCHDGKGNILLHWRSKKCRDEQERWDCGAGAVEFEETLEEAVRREIKEEYCVEPIDLRQAGINSVFRKNGKVDTHWVATLFVAKVNPSQIKIGEPKKMDKIGWFRHDNLPTPAHSMLLEHLDMIKKSGDEFLI